MPELTDYIELESLRQLQTAFSAAAAARLEICDAEGNSPFEPAEGIKSSGSCEAPVVVDGKTIALVRLYPSDSTPQAAEHGERILKLAADMLGRLCRQQSVLRDRVDELGVLYRLTAEFTGQKDLQSVLDMVTDTVVHTLNAKACAIRLLNEDKTELVIKAVANLSPEYLNKGPILLSDSKIDQEVLQSGEPVYVADQSTDPRVLYPAEAKREGIVSGLCTPLNYKGRSEGVIRVYMDRPHKFDWFEVSLLQTIAANAAAAIVNARLYQQAVLAANMKRQLHLAGIVQRRMIPAKPPDIEGFDIAGTYVPCFELGGDFYDFNRLDENNLAISICDVIGKGVRASLLMASIRASLRAHAAEVYEMSEVLAKVNKVLCADSLSSDFATLFYSVLDSKSRRLTYANAGHIPPLLFRDGQLQHLSAGGSVLGVDKSAQWQQDSIICQSGDVIFAYTDGISDAMNFDDETFGHQRVADAAKEAIQQQYSAEGIVKHVLWQMRRFAGLQKRFDDLTIVTIKVL